MSKHLVCAATMGAVILFAGAAQAQTLAYSFESGLDGFFGLGATVSQESVLGVTHLSNSLRYTAGIGAFVGARTETVLPAELNNPPGVEFVLFDLYIPEVPAGVSFANLGITIFGHDLDTPAFGTQYQFTDTVSITSLGAGQHYNLRIDLDSEAITGESFNQIFGDDITDSDVAAAFQFFISKTSGPGSDVTVYIDNVRLIVPEPTTLGMFAIGAAVVGSTLRRRRC